MRTDVLSVGVSLRVFMRCDCGTRGDGEEKLKNKEQSVKEARLYAVPFLREREAYGERKNK